MMKTTVSQYQFIDAFTQMNRGDNFSHAGLVALFEYLESIDPIDGLEYELDVVGLCCEYSEYEDLEEIQKNYTSVENMEDLHNHTFVIEFSGGIIIQDF